MRDFPMLGILGVVILNIVILGNITSASISAFDIGLVLLNAASAIGLAVIYTHYLSRLSGTFYFLAMTFLLLTILLLKLLNGTLNLQVLWP